MIPWTSYRCKSMIQPKGRLFYLKRMDPSESDPSESGNVESEEDESEREESE